MADDSMEDAELTTVDSLSPTLTEPTSKLATLKACVKGNWLR